MAEMARSVVSPVGAGFTKQSFVLLLGVLLFVAACNQEQETGVEAGGANGPRGTSASASSDQGTREQIRNDQANKDADRAAAEQARRDQLAAEERRADAANNTRLEEIASQERIAMRNAEIQAEQANLRDLSQQQNTEAQKYISDNNLEAQLANARTQESAAQMNALATVGGAAIQGSGNLIGQMANASALKDQAQATRDSAVIREDGQTKRALIAAGANLSPAKVQNLREAVDSELEGVRRQAGQISAAEQLQARIRANANSGIVSVADARAINSEAVALGYPAPFRLTQERVAGPNGTTTVIEGAERVNDSSGRPLTAAIDQHISSRLPGQREALADQIDAVRNSDEFVMLQGAGAAPRLPSQESLNGGRDLAGGGNFAQGFQANLPNALILDLRSDAEKANLGNMFEPQGGIKSELRTGLHFSDKENEVNNVAIGFKSWTPEGDATTTTLSDARLREINDKLGMAIVGQDGRVVHPQKEVVGGLPNALASDAQVQANRDIISAGARRFSEKMASATTDAERTAILNASEQEVANLARDKGLTYGKAAAEFCTYGDPSCGVAAAAEAYLNQRDNIEVVTAMLLKDGRFSTNPNDQAMATHALNLRFDGENLVDVWDPMNPNATTVVEALKSKFLGMTREDILQGRVGAAAVVDAPQTPNSVPKADGNVDQAKLRESSNVAQDSQAGGEVQAFGSPGSNPTSADAPDPIIALGEVMAPQPGDADFVGPLPEDFDFGANAPANNNSNIGPLAQADRDADLDSGVPGVAAGGAPVYGPPAPGSEPELPSLDAGSGPTFGGGGAGAGAANQNGNSGRSTSAPLASNVNNSNNKSANPDALSGSDTIDDGGGVGGLQRDLEEIQRRAQQEQYVCVGGIEKEECAGFTEAVNDLTSLRSDVGDLEGIKKQMDAARAKFNQSQSEADRQALNTLVSQFNQKKSALEEKLSAFNEKLQNLSLPQVAGKTEATVQLFEDSVKSLQDAIAGLDPNQSGGDISDKLAILDQNLNILNDKTVEDINYAEYGGEGSNGGLASYRAAGTETANYRGGNVSDGNLYLPRGN